MRYRTQVIQLPERGGNNVRLSLFPCSRVGTLLKRTQLVKYTLANNVINEPETCCWRAHLRICMGGAPCYGGISIF